MKKKRLYGTYTCGYDNGAIILPVFFPVRNGEVAFIDTCVKDPVVWHFSLENLDCWEIINIKDGILTLPEVHAAYPCQLFCVEFFGRDFRVSSLPFSTDAKHLGQVSEQTDCKVLGTYLADTAVTAIGQGKYDFLLQAINLLDKPGRLLNSNLYSLPKDSVMKIFRTIYVPYREKVIKDKPYWFKSKRSYFLQENQRTWREIETSTDRIDKMLKTWVMQQYPVRMAATVEHVKCFTPHSGKDGLQFFQIDGAILGSHTPYMEDHSSYIEINIFHR